MTRISTLIIFILALSINAVYAQIPDGSPYPVDFRVLAPSSIVGSYDYGTMVLGTAAGSVAWGDTLTQTVTGNLAWAYGSANDSIACTPPVVTDLTGKVALIRRGSCDFWRKVLAAQEAGAVGAIIVNHYNSATDNATSLFGMSANNDSAQMVNIPAIFISRQTGESLIPKIDAGETVEVSFYVPRFYNAVGANALYTPESMINPWGTISANYFNPTPDVETGVEAKCDITDPNGSISTLTITADVAGLKDSVLTFDQYIPDAGQGEYQLMFTNNKSLDTLRLSHFITDYKYALDNAPGSTFDNWTGVDSASFSNNGLHFDVGSIYFTNFSGVATHASFGLHNPADFAGDVFTMYVYNPTVNNTSFVNPFRYDQMGEPLAFKQITMTGNETADSEIIVEFDDPITLPDTSAAFVVIRYDGSVVGTGKIPQFSANGATNYPSIATIVNSYNSAASAGQQTDYLYTGGWSGGTNNVVRLYMNGAFPVNTNDPVLKKDQVLLFPNPAQDYINVKIELENTSDAELIVTDVIGRVITTKTLKDVKAGTYPYDVRNLSNGNYFLTVKTKEGWRTKVFNVAK